MNEWITDLFSQFSFPLSLPWLLAAGVGVLLGLVALVFFLHRLLFLRKATRLYAQGEFDENVHRRLATHPALVDALVARLGDGLIAHFQVADALKKRLIRKRRARDAQRLLGATPQEGAGTVFQVALSSPSVARVYSQWLQSQQGLWLLTAAAQTLGEGDFNSQKAAQLFQGREGDLRELFGNPHWIIRLFALRILLHDDSEASRRSVLECLADPHPQLRMLSALQGQPLSDQEFLLPSFQASGLGPEIESDEEGAMDEASLPTPLGESTGDHLPSRLLALASQDPMVSVRQAARERLHRDYPSWWNPSFPEATPLERAHLVALAKPESSSDLHFAYQALEDEDALVRLAASRVLEASGQFKLMLQQANLGDREDWARRERLLKTAVDVGTTSFLEDESLYDTTDSLLLALRAGRALPSSLGRVAGKVFSKTTFPQSPEEWQLYRELVVACARWGDRRCHEALHLQLKERREDGRLLGILLPQLAPQEAAVYRPTLMEFLAQENFIAHESLVTLLRSFPSDVYLHGVMDLMEDENQPQVVRARCVRVLAGWHLNITLQSLLEHLPLLSPQECEALAPDFEALDPSLFTQRATYLFSTPDAPMRAALMRALPHSFVSQFETPLKEALMDVNSEIRIAALGVLVRSGELHQQKMALTLLKDPVEEVRREASLILAHRGGAKIFQALQELVLNEEEVRSVRQAALDGLAASSTPEAIDVLVMLLDTPGREEEAEQALSQVHGQAGLRSLVEHFRDGEAPRRERLVRVFTAMGGVTESILVKLLEEGVPSLEKPLSSILTQCGYVDGQIRKLHHRDPLERQRAATRLAQIATAPAYRGIVMAARDPDTRVRVEVSHALEALAEPEGRDILQALKEDPERKVRHYALWASERLKAKG